MESTRKTPRYRFVAPAGVIPQTSGTKLESWVKELSLYGRCLDTSPPLPVRTCVHGKIYGRDDFYEATAKVIYANATLGIGQVFREVRPTYMEVLRRWLLEALGQAASETEDRFKEPCTVRKPRAPENAPQQRDREFSRRRLELLGSAEGEEILGPFHRVLKPAKELLKIGAALDEIDVGRIDD